MLRLAVELLSPLCTASGAGRPGFVDREVTIDSEGLPYIPARRLKGLLRDAWREVFDSPVFLNVGLPSPDEIFGASGRELGGGLHLDNARLPDSEELGRWLRSQTSEKSRRRCPFARDEVIGEYTEIRRQTAIDPRLGSAQEETLRAIRVLRAGQIFYATVTHTDCERVRHALAISAAALRSMGSARSRGTGEVRCRLEEQLDGNSWQDLTGSALDALESGNLGATDAPAEPTHAPETAPPAPTVDAEELYFELRFTEPALFPSLAGDPFTVTSYDYVPGSAIRGMLARRYLDSRPVGGEFADLFTGPVSFLPAFPAWYAGNEAQRTSPIPHSVRAIKGTDENVDLALESAPAESLQRSRGWCDPSALGRYRLVGNVQVLQSLQYHHKRALDRRVQRAVGAENEEDHDLTSNELGAFFTYEPIQQRQGFVGIIAGPLAALKRLCDLIQTGDTVALGRSRNAQYGGKAVWNWIDGPLRTTAPDRLCERIRVTLDSPLLGCNDSGHPAPAFPTAELRFRLYGGDGGTLTYEREWTRVEWHSSYLAHQGLPLQQMPALAAGSVFLFGIDPPVQESCFRDAAQLGFGFRTEDGFGRLRLEYPFPEMVEDEEPPARFEFTPLSSWPKETMLSAPLVVRTLAANILRRRIREQAGTSALALCSQAKGINLVPPHLLSRLTHILETSTLAEFAARFSKEDTLMPGVRWADLSREEQLQLGEEERQQLRSRIKPAARGKLERVKLNMGGGMIRTLEEYLRSSASNPSPLFATLVQEAQGLSALLWTGILGDSPLLKGPNQPADPDFAADLVRQHLIALLNALALAQRAERRGQEQAAEEVTK